MTAPSENRQFKPWAPNVRRGKTLMQKDGLTTTQGGGSALRETVASDILGLEQK